VDKLYEFKKLSESLVDILEREFDILWFQLPGFFHKISVTVFHNALRKLGVSCLFLSEYVHLFSIGIKLNYVKICSLLSTANSVLLFYTHVGDSRPVVCKWKPCFLFTMIKNTLLTLIGKFIDHLETTSGGRKINRLIWKGSEY
jgi:hypothetical protein